MVRAHREGRCCEFTRRTLALRVRTRSGLSRRATIGVVALAAVVIVGFALLRMGRSGLPEIKPTDLDAARERWAGAAVENYDIAITLAGRQSGEIKVQVRGGRPTAMTRNGVQPKQERTWEPWTVPGMFDTIDVDFDNRKDAREKFGVEPESVKIRCEFDPEFGYPKRYLHQTFGRQQDLEWTVTEFVRQ